MKTLRHEFLTVITTVCLFKHDMCNALNSTTVKFHVQIKAHAHIPPDDLLQWKKQRPRKSCQLAIIAAASAATELIGVFLAISRSQDFQASKGFHIPRDAIISRILNPRWRAASVPQLAGIHTETRLQLPWRKTAQQECQRVVGSLGRIRVRSHEQPTHNQRHSAEN